MKKVFNTIFAIVSTALTIVSCSKELEILSSSESESESQSGRTVTLKVTALDTKTAITDPGTGTSYGVKWTEGDQLGVYEVADGAVQNKQSSAGLDSDGVEKTFTFNLAAVDGASTFDYTFVYPSSAVSKSTGQNPIYRISIKDKQTFLANSFDKDADLLVSEHKQTATQPTELTLNFARIGATARMVLTGKTTEEVIKQVKFSTIEGNIAGYKKIDPSTGLIDANDEGVYSGQKEIVLTPAADDLALSGDVVVWFRLYDITLVNNFTVFVKTNLAEYTKSINLAAASKSLQFKEGALTTFTVDLSTNTDRVDVLSGTTYNLVSSMDDDFVDGAKYILVGRYETNKMSYARFDALGAEGGSGASAYRASVNLIAESDEVAKGSIPSKILVPDSKAVYPIEIGKVGNTNNYYLKDVYSGSSTENKYFKANSNNALIVNDNNTDDAAQWTIIITSSVPTITNVGNSRVISPNISNNRFAAYTAAQGSNTLLLYIDPSSAIPTLATPQNLAASDKGEGQVDVVWDAVTGADSYTVTMTGQTTKTGITSTSTSFTGVAVGTYTVTVTAISDDQSVAKNSAAASTTVIVGTPALGKPVISSFTETATGFSAEIAESIEYATSYDWTLYEGSVNDNNVHGMGNTTDLSFSVPFTSTDVDIDAFTPGTTYYLVVTATAVGYTSTDSDPANFVAATPSYDFETVAELNALVTSSGDNTKNNNAVEYSGKLTSAVVSFRPDANNAIIKDASGSILVYKTSHGLLQGQTFSGELTVSAKLYYTTVEITAIDASFTGSQSEVLPVTMTLSQLEGNFSTYQNAYVKVEGLTVTAKDGKNISVSDGSKTYLVYDNANASTAGVGDVITAVGTVADHSGTNQIKVWASSDITVTGSAPKAITFSQPASGGSFTVSVGGSTITSGTTVASGTTVTLTATAANDYTFNGWTVSGATIADASAATTTFTMGTSAVSIAASFKEEGSTAPAAGTVLWTDTFGDWGGASTTFTNLPELSEYTYTGRSGYSDNTDVTLTASSNQVRGTTSSGGNCTSGHLWFNKSQNATVTTSAIRLYGATSLVLSYDQGTSGSSLTAGYSTDGGTTWTDFSASSPAAGNEYTFTVQSGTSSVILRFVHSSSNAKNTRFDNPKLAVGN